MKHYFGKMIKEKRQINRGYPTELQSHLWEK